MIINKGEQAYLNLILYIKYKLKNIRNAYAYQKLFIKRIKK